MKKFAALALAMLTICALAFAAAYRAGILDFAGRYPDSYVPKDAQDYIHSDVLTLENDAVSVSIGELYYDGRISRATIHIAPKDPSTLLLGPMTLPEDQWQNMARLDKEWDEADTRTVADFYREGGYQSAYSVDTWMQPLDGDTTGGSGDDNIGPDGTLTLYSQVEYADDQPVRDVLFRVYLSRYEAPLTVDSRLLPEQTVVLEAPLTLRADTALHETYVSAEPAVYPSVGVRVDEVRIEVRPQDIHAMINYTVIDREAYDRQEDGLWFEFINPESPAEEPYAQRLMSGMSGSGSAGPLDGDPDTATRFRQSETLGRNELHSAYTLRAFNCWDKTRYETHTFAMKRLEE